jgi:hypothetical protein
MSTRKPTGASKEPRFVGVSIEDFLDETSKVVKAGKYQDGTTIDPRVRTALSKFTDALSEPALRIRNYVFVFSRCCLIVLDARAKSGQR